MELFTLLQTLDDAVAPERCKLHLAGWNGTDDPLAVYFEGRFGEWQSWQRRKNFERDFVVALIALSQPDLWLFAGVHEALQVEWVDRRDLFRYRMTRRPACDELDGRLVVQFRRPGRQSYLLAENWAAQLQVHELRAQKMAYGANKRPRLGRCWSSLPSSLRLCRLRCSSSSSRSLAG